MGAIGKFVGGAVGAVGGFFAGGPAGAIAGASLGYGLGGGMKSSKPPAINNQAANPIANQLPPVNFVSVLDQISGQNFSITRGADNRIDLKFGGNSRVALDAPIDIDQVNTNLPAVRPVRGRNLPEIEQAANVVVLTSALRQLGDTLELMERTSPLLVAQHQDLLTSYKTAQQRALDKGFDYRQNGLDVKLAKMGLLNSSTALGTQVALAREKSDATLKANLDYNVFAQGLKQQSIENIQKEGEHIATNAGIELGRFNSESANKLQLRGQDMQAELAVQQLEQQRASEQARLQLASNDQRIGAELGRRGLAADQTSKLLQAGLNTFAGSNDQAIGARTVDNKAISENNYFNQQRYGLTSNPWKEAFNVGLGSFAGGVGGNFANRLLQAPTKRKVVS